MLKIKFNINKFTIIFLEKIGKKINAEKLSAQPSLFNFSAAPFSVPTLFFFQLQRFSLLLFSSGQCLFLLLFLFWSAPLSSLVLFTQCPPFLLSVFLLYSFVFSASFFFSSRRVALFYQPKNIFFSLKPFFSPKRFCLNPKYFFSSAQKYYFQPKTFLLQPKILFQFSPKISPCFWFSTSFFLFLFFLPFFSAFSHYVLPFFSPSVQLKTFFNCFMSLYLSKSSFSSNLK